MAEDVVGYVAQAIRDANASSAATEWWIGNPHTIPADIYAQAAVDALDRWFLAGLKTAMHEDDDMPCACIGRPGCYCRDSDGRWKTT